MASEARVRRWTVRANMGQWLSSMHHCGALCPTAGESDLHQVAPVRRSHLTSRRALRVIRLEGHRTRGGLTWQDQPDWP